MDQNIHDSESHIGNSFFENLISGFWAYNVFIFVHTFQWTSSEFIFSFQIFENSPGQKRTSGKDHSFCKTVSLKKTSLILRTSTHLTMKCSSNTAKNLSDFANFPAHMFLFGVRKNICTAPFLDSQEPHSWSTLIANVFIFLYISVRKFLFQRRSKVLSDGCGLGETE